MRQAFVALMIAGLTLGSTLVSTVRLKADPTDVSQHSHHPYANVEILIGGTPQPQYAHQGRWYVEAIKGREYEIRLRNPYTVRVAVALSVDGLNTIDAQRTAASRARKWVLGPHETITISGWQVSSTHARKFEFTTEEKSYAQALGKAANLGVISAAFFRERIPVNTGIAEPYRDSNPPSADARRAPQSGAPSSGPSPWLAGEAMSESAQTRKDQEYAATGMGDRTGHAVTLVRLDLENTPAQTINIRYEYHDQLVRLGILPPRTHVDPLDPLGRRERSRGFEAGFSPEIR